MVKTVHDDVLDGALNIIKNNCTKVTVCTSAPTSYVEGNATYAIADVTVDSADFTNQNGDVNGRKSTLGAQSAVPIDTSGTATHLAYLDVANTKLLLVTSTTSQVLTSGGTVDIPAVDQEIADPV